MQRIISHGNIMKRKGRTICEECKCDFTYDIEDVRIGADIISHIPIKYVICPECLNQIAIDNGVKYAPYCLSTKIYI